MASIPTEAEALSRVLAAHTAVHIPKSKQKRKQNLPTGGAKYDSTSPEWVTVLENQENRAAAKKQKTTAKPKKTSAPKQVSTGRKNWEWPFGIFGSSNTGTS